jgi:hypothetical protein
LRIAERSEPQTQAPVGEVGDEGLVLTRSRGGTWRQTIDVTDPRLEGDIYQRWESDGYAVPEGKTGPTVAAMRWRIENDEGAWQGGQTELVLADGTQLRSLTTLTGEGAYEGLTALMSVVGFEEGCTADIRGVIVEGVPAHEPYGPSVGLGDALRRHRGPLSVAAIASGRDSPLPLTQPLARVTARAEDARLAG